MVSDAGTCVQLKTPTCDTSDMKQRLNDARASISQNVIDKAVGQSRKWLHATTKAKEHQLEHLLNKNRLFSDPPLNTTGSFQIHHSTQPALFRATNSLPRKNIMFHAISVAAN